MSQHDCNSIRDPDISYTEMLLDEDDAIEQSALYDSMVESMKEEKEINIIIQCSKQEYIDHIEKIEFEKKIRKESLFHFMKRIKGLSFTKQDIEIKEYIEQILSEYIELSYDYVYVPEKMYIPLYSIIDSYYQIPVQKQKKCAISKEEDTLIRSIFLKGNYDE